MKKAISFVANDKILHYFLPFLSSLRAWMPEAELYMISYDGNDAEARKAAARYDVKIISHETQHEEISQLSQVIFGKMKGHLRKLESFYIDADILMQVDVDVELTTSFKDLIDTFAESNFDFCFGEPSPDYVYSNAGLAAFPESNLFSTGFLILRPHVHRVSNILETVIENKAEYELYRDPRVVDQPLLNYYVDKNKLRCIKVDDLLADTTGRSFYLHPDIQVDFTTSLPTARWRGKNVLMVHYAGRPTLDGEFRYKNLISYYEDRYASEAKDAPTATKLFANKDAEAAEQARRFKGGVIGANNDGDDYQSEYRRIVQTYLTLKTGNLLEWGSGPTTRLIVDILEARGTLPRLLLTLDDNASHLQAMIRGLGAVPYIRPVVQTLPGRTVDQFDPGPNYSSYPLTIGEHFDFIFIDGRRRVECAFVAALLSHADTIVVVHDYRRDRYQSMTALFDIVEDGRQFRVMKPKVDVVRLFDGAIGDLAKKFRSI